MALKLEIDAIKNYYAGVVERAIDETLEEGLAYAKAISPTDTGAYVSEHKINRAQNLGSSVVGSLENDVRSSDGYQYAHALEFGVLGQSYNYHKGPPRNASTRIFSGVGNRTYQRTLDQIKPILERKLSNGN